jgi:hypothetical protein
VKGPLSSVHPVGPSDCIWRLQIVVEVSLTCYKLAAELSFAFHHIVVSQALVFYLIVVEVSLTCYKLAA